MMMSAPGPKSILMSLMFAIMAGFGVTPAQSPGKIAASVPVDKDPSQSYAIYLPTNFTSGKRLPLIYVFDPRGRGETAVEVYRPAAEKFGYIVVGSNNSRNGLDIPKLAPIIENLFEDTHKKFAIDDGRVLAAGLSGGSRVASYFAHGCNGCVFGVIGSAAGLFPNIPVSDKLPFIYFGSVGYDDYNFLEFQQLEKQLAASHITSRIEAFDGGHQWPPEPLTIEAVAWMEIIAMKAGRRPIDTGIISDFVNVKIQKAAELTAIKDFLGSVNEYRTIVVDLNGLTDTTLAGDKLRALEASDEYRKAQKNFADILKQEIQTTNEFLALGGKLADPNIRAETLAQMRDRAAAVVKKANGKAGLAETHQAKRIVSQVFAAAMDYAGTLIDDGKAGQLALDSLLVAEMMNPNSPQLFYVRARIAAVKGDVKKCVESLSKATSLGLRDIGRVSSDHAFDKVRSDERFINLIKSAAAGK